MSQEIIPTPNRHKFSFGFVIFCIFFMIPVLTASVFMYREYKQNLIEMKCVEQNRTYINSICFDIPVSLLKMK